MTARVKIVIPLAAPVTILDAVSDVVATASVSTVFVYDDKQTRFASSRLPLRSGGGAIGGKIGGGGGRGIDGRGGRR
jgi:hypothetical protein